MAVETKVNRKCNYKTEKADMKNTRSVWKRTLTLPRYRARVPHMFAKPLTCVCYCVQKYTPLTVKTTTIFMI